VSQSVLASGLTTIVRATRLYEQERGKSEGLPRLGAYVTRWLRWMRSSLCGVRGVDQGARGGQSAGLVSKFTVTPLSSESRACA
jgi:hypothetical protein